MKSQVHLLFLISFLFTFSSGYAQQKITGKIFTGEWYYKAMHDTIVLEKVTKSKTDYQKWIFQESGQMRFETLSSGKYTLKGKAKGTWIFDEASVQLKITREKQSTFLLIGFDGGSVKLKMLK